MLRDDTLPDEVALLCEATEAYNRGGIASVEPYLDEAIELHDAGLFRQAAAYRGKAEVIKYYRQVEAGFEDIWLEPLEFIQRPPAIVVPFRLSAHGGRLRMIANTAFWLRDRRVVRIRTFRSRESALRYPYAEAPIVG